MKKLFNIFILTMVCSICTAQNLVLNGGLEQFHSCPTGYGQVDSALFWITPTSGGTSDYLNQCAPASSNVSVPVNFNCNTYQLPHGGDGYAAIINYSDNGVNYREYIEGSLSAPLSASVCYSFEMYISVVNCCKYAADGLGVYFSNTPVYGVQTNNMLPFIPQISNPQLNYYTDTANWVLFSGTFIAQGGEQYFIIGNFSDDANTNKITINANGYYPNNFIYIDDVSLSVCTGIIENANSNDKIKIYFEPASDKLNIAINNNEQSEIILYDMASKKVLVQKFVNSIRLNTQHLSKGIYLYELKNKSGIIQKGKIMKD